MSTRKGASGKTRQKYQNATAFKADLHGESRQTKLAKVLPLDGLCIRCKEKLEWKKKYGKYKPLTVPRKCVCCLQKKVTQAYYVLCRDCAAKRQVCAKCTKIPNEIMKESCDPEVEPTEEGQASTLQESLTGGAGKEERQNCELDGIEEIGQFATSFTEEHNSGTDDSSSEEDTKSGIALSPT